jgi:hypothetical protein
MSPFYLHLAKGALLLESIGKMVIRKRSQVQLTRDMLLDVLNHPNIKTGILANRTIKQNFNGQRVNTLDTLLQYVDRQSSFDRANIYSIALTIRNTTSHSLNWDTSIDFSKTQRKIYDILTEALFAMIELVSNDPF